MLTEQKSTGSMLSALAILISCLILVSDCGVTTDGGHCDRESEGGDCQHSAPVLKQFSQFQQNGLDGSVTMATLQDFPNSQPSGANINIIREIASSAVYKKFGTLLLNDEHEIEMSILATRSSGDSVKIVMDVFKLWTQGMKGLHPRTWRTLVRCLREVELDDLADDIEDFFPLNIENKFAIPDSPPSSCATCLCWCVPSLWKNRDDKRFTKVCHLLQQAKILVGTITTSNIKEAEAKLEVVSIELDRLINRLLNQKVRAGMVGLTKAGKSTLLNALLGRSFLPSSLQPQTAKEVTIIHDMSKPEGELRCIGSTDNTTLAVGQQVISHELLKLNEEVRKHGEQSQKCDQLVLFAPLKFLSTVENEGIKLELADTPGFGEAGAESIADKVDVVVKDLCVFMLILNSQFLKTESEQSLLEKLTKYHPELFSEMNRVLILVNGYENIYEDKKMGSNMSLTPEEIPTYISNYFNESLDIEIPPEKIILFNALWALRSREWRRESILKEGPKKAKTLFGDALQMLRYIDKDVKADELERNLTDENINIAISILEPFSQIENIENLLQNMVVENGGLILLESSVDDTVSVLNRTLLPAITELIGDEQTESKKARVESVKEIDTILEDLLTNGKAVLGDLYPSLVYSSSTLHAALQEALSATYNKLMEDNPSHWVENPLEDEGELVKEMSQAINSSAALVLAEMKRNCLKLSNTVAEHLSRAFSDLKTSFYSLSKISSEEKDSDLSRLIEYLSSTILPQLMTADDCCASLTTSQARSDCAAVEDGVLKTYIEETKQKVFNTERFQEIIQCTGWWPLTVKSCRPIDTSFKIAFDSVFGSWNNFYDEQVGNYLVDISNSTEEACISKLKNILEEPRQNVTKMLEDFQKALEKAQRNASFLRKTKQELKILSQMLRDSIKK